MHAVKAAGRFGKAGLLFERLAVMPGCLQILFPSFVNPAKVEMRESVGFITRRVERAFEPANAAVRIALRQQITTDIVVGISQCFIDANCLQAFCDRFVVAVLKTVNPAQERMRFGRWISLN